MVKKLIVSSLLAISVMGIIPVAASATWKQDKQKNYRWIENGVEAKGWKKINGEWYNFGDYGIMQMGWFEDNGNWYYSWTNGMMASNCWIKSNGFWYYFDESGKMATKSNVIGNRIYDFTQPLFVISHDLDSNKATIDSTNTNKN